MGVKGITIVLVLLLVAIIAYGAPVVLQQWYNSTLTESVPVGHVDWSLVKMNDEEWRPLAQFSYVVAGERFEQKEQFQGEKFRNPYVGQEALKALQENYTRVWFAPRKPAHGTLEKYFPQKRAIYAAILFGLYIYLIWGIRWYTRYMLSKFPK